MSDVQRPTPPLTEEELAQMENDYQRNNGWHPSHRDVPRLIAALRASRAEVELHRSRADRASELRRENGLLRSEVERLRTALDEAQLRSIEARNPGIDMAEVRRLRESPGPIPRGEAEVEHQRWCPL